jgi:hypothetical protein
MSIEHNKAIARRHYEELWHKGDLARPMPPVTRSETDRSGA